MNELSLVEVLDNQITLNEEASLMLSNYLKMETEIKIFKDKIKNEILNAFESTDRSFYEDNNIKITKRKGSTRTTLDTERLKQEHPEIYEEYSKTNTSKPSISMELK